MLSTNTTLSHNKSLCKFVILEGTIAAGKTCLGKEIEELYPGKTRFIKEPRGDENPYLALFYKDPKKYILPMQHWFLAKRLQDYALIANKIENGEFGEDFLVVFDRCIFSDQVFLDNAKDMGYMTDEQHSNFIKCRNDVISCMPQPNLVIYLDINPTTSLNRILKIRKDEAEVGIELDYLQNLEKCYKSYIKNLEQTGIKVKKIDWEVFGFENQTTEENYKRKTFIKELLES